MVQYPSRLKFEGHYKQILLQLGCHFFSPALVGTQNSSRSSWQNLSVKTNSNPTDNRNLVTWIIDLTDILRPLNVCKLKGELHLKFWSIRIKISKFQKHHNKIPKHVFYHLVKFFLNFHTFYSKKIDFR